MNNIIFEKLSTKIYNENFNLLINFFRKKGISDSNINNELTHNTLTKGILTLDKLKIKDTDSVRKWLYTIANNEYNDYFRKNKSNQLIFVDEYNEININLNNEDNFIIDEIQHILNETEFKLIHKYYIEGYKFEEIAKIYNKSPKAIKCKIYKIKDKLKEQLEFV